MALYCDFVRSDPLVELALFDLGSEKTRSWKRLSDMSTDEHGLLTSDR